MSAGDATTWLFVPGNRPERFDKAADSGADAVILDLEDAVGTDDKAESRGHVVTWLATGNPAWVRINGESTIWHADDIAAIAYSPGLRGVVVPKAEDLSLLSAIAAALPQACEIVALIESAKGVRQAHQIAASPSVARLAFGSVDFAADIVADHDDDLALLLARSTLVLASRAAGCPAPVDGITLAVDDLERVEREACRARALGFGAKLCIHPAQLAPARLAFSISAEEIAWAKGVMSAADGMSGAARGPDGTLIDKPVVDRARAILDA